MFAQLAAPMITVGGKINKYKLGHNIERRTTCKLWSNKNGGRDIFNPLPSPSRELLGCPCQCHWFLPIRESSPRIRVGVQYGRPERPDTVMAAIPVITFSSSFDPAVIEADLSLSAA